MTPPPDLSIESMRPRLEPQGHTAIGEGERVLRPAPTEFPVRHGRARIFASAAQLDPSDWQSALSADAKDWRYQEICEASLKSGFDYRYLVLTDRAGQTVLIQPFFLNDQDITEGLGAGLRAPLLWLRRWFPRFLKMRMLMVGSTGGEGSLGLTIPASDARASDAIDDLLEAVHLYGRENGVAVITFKDFKNAWRETLTAPAAARGFVRMPSFPATVIPLREYKSFDDYLSRRLSKAMRKNLRRKFRADEKPAAPPRLRMEVRHEIADCVDELLPLYQQVFARSQFRFEELTREYFLGLGERMPDRARFFIWRLTDTGRAVAFSSCMVHDGTLYDNYLGLDYAHALDLHLYFVTIRDLIAWGIAERLHTYYSTPLNYDPKLHLRFDLAPLDLYVRHVNGFFNVFFRRIAPLLEPTRYDPFLRRFANFAALNS